MRKKTKEKLRKLKKPLMLLMIVSIPFFFGLGLTWKIRKEIEQINRAFKVAHQNVKFSIDDYSPGLFSTKFSLKANYLFMPETPGTGSINIEMSNLPALSYLSKGQMRFNFTGKTDKVELVLNTERFNPKFTINNVEFSGGLVAPNGIELAGTVQSISNANQAIKTQVMNFDFRYFYGEWLATASAENMLVQKEDGKFDVTKFKFTSNNAENDGLGFTLGFKMKSQKVGDTEMKFSSGGTIHHLPQVAAIEAFGFKAFSDSGTSFEVSAKVIAGKPYISTTLNGQSVKDGVETNGDFTIFLPEEERKNKVLSPVVLYLNDNADEFKRNYNVDLLQIPAKFTYSVKEGNLLLKGKRYYQCSPPIPQVTSQFKTSVLKTIPLEQIKFEAIEDLLSEDDPNKLAESYCRLDYADEFSGAEDYVVTALKNLIKVRAGYINSKDGADSKHEMITFKRLESKLENDKELLVLANQLHCYINKEGHPCISNRPVVPFIEEHPLMQLFSLLQKDSLTSQEVESLTVAETDVPYKKRLYDLVKSKLFFSTYSQEKKLKELVNHINTYSKNFSRNFMRYQIVDYTCNFKQEGECLELIERSHPGFTNPKLTQRYVDMKVKLMRDLRSKGRGPDCAAFVTELAILVPQALNNTNFQLLRSECGVANTQ